MALQDNFDIARVVRDAVDKRVKEIANEEFDKAVERIEERRDEVVTGTVLSIEKYVSFERMGQTLKIEIKEKSNPTAK